ncbi:RGG repeats nuclear RNA binding protein A-like [Herrania umbratica]|uniref:RGG repeats nuclear RNA binding protein A-like n=1 Tax=Herrania umbratica TaxID=108875 RepID=A0A6J1AUY5_9ROSI|nr:RGG repeats nuclear RNA binding protein A-like [Herrania umbratica]
MAQEKNFFALLTDQESEDVSKLIDSLKVEEPSKPDALDNKKEQKPTHKFQNMDPRKMLGKRIILPRHVLRSFLGLRKEKKEEQKPEGNSNAKEPGEKEGEIKASSATNNNGQQPSSGNGANAKIECKNYPDNHHNHGYHHGQRGYGVGNGYQGNYRNYSYGGGDGYRENYGTPPGYQVNNNGGYRGGRRSIRGKGFQQRRKFYEEQALAYANNHLHQQEFDFGKEDLQYYGGYRGQGHQGYYRRDGGECYNNGKVYCEVDGDNEYNNDNSKNDNIAVVANEGQEAAASKSGHSEEGNGDYHGDKKSEMMERKSKGFEDKSVIKAEEKEKVNDGKKLMTLKEYEESLLEKKKPVEALKKDVGRKVMADKEFGSMQMIGKKKEEKKYETKRKDTCHSLEEENVIRKSMSLNEFLKPAEGREKNKQQHGDRAHGQRPYGRGYYDQRNYGRQEWKMPLYGGCRPYNRGRGDDYSPQIEDLSQFPVLGRNGTA